MADDDPQGGYGNKHRAFLQALLSRQTITYQGAKPILAAIETAAKPDRPTLAEDVSEDHFQWYIDTINPQISPFDLEIRHTRHQESREWVYALVNMTSDALTQMATIHTADELAFVKRVLDAMFDANNTQRAEVMAVTAMQALKLAKAPSEGGRGESTTQTQASQAGLTMKDAQKVLNNMVSEGWFEKSARDFYTLTPRALMELRGWLKDTYNDLPPEDGDEDEEELDEKIKNCLGCGDIVTMGVRCPNLVCKVRLHQGCERTQFRAQRGNEQCPSCMCAWVDAPPVGELAAKSGNGRRSTNDTASGRRSSAVSVAAGDGSDDN